MRTASLDEALDFAQQQVQQLVRTPPGKMPTYTETGQWVIATDPWAPSWTGGVLTGLIWLAAERSGSELLAEQAEGYCALLEPRMHDSGTHDLGFIFDPSCGRWFDRSASPKARDVLVQAGRTMAGRFNEPGAYLPTWVDPGSTFIDIMMNVGVIFRAAALTGDQRLHDIALAHCRTTIRHLMRGDGSTLHEGWFDPTSGQFLRAGTHQGWRPDSSWARGQAWAIYGFTTAFGHTGDPDLLHAARRAADYYIRCTPPDGVCPNDWLDPAPPHRWEASAAAIAAAGMLHLAASLAATPEGNHYRAYALGILETLRSTEFLAIETPGWQGILKHATYHYREGIGVDESLIFGDYYFVEALTLAAALPAEAGPAA